MEPYPGNKPGVLFTEEESLFPVINYLVYRECHPWWVIKKHPVDRFDMTYVIQGGARYVIDGTSYELTPGDLLCLREGTLKEAATYSKNFMHCFSVNFELRDIRNQAVFLPFPQFSRIGILPDLIQHFQELVHISLVRQPGYMLKCAGLLLLILHRIYELTVLNIGADVKDSRIQNIIRYIVQHYAEQLSVRCLADKAKLNPAYLGALFKKETGESIHQYIAKIRVRNAKNILSAGGYRVSEVAEQCGYCDIYHFYKQFKTITGKAPSRYLPHNK
ncbi:MAG: helix-turn-helix domain-containing protein [Treponema sp.]|jgi:AraC-like DNA-binding protein|nr:helix-turn-helix domain-containing protein [Treponema sp.]